MALTRGDKMIILGAVVLAASVVMGLALLKKPQLFSGAPAPVSEVAAPGAIAPAPAATPAPPAPVTAAPVAPAPTAVAISPPPTSAPSTAPAAPSPHPAPPIAPSPPAATGAAAAGAARSPLAGDETLERMFAEISRDTAVAAKKGAEPRPAGAEHGPAGVESGPSGDMAPAGSTPVVVAEPKAAPAPVPAAAPTPAKPVPPGPTPAKTETKAVKDTAKAPPASKAAPEPARPAKAEAKPKAAPPVQAKPAAAEASGEVVRLVAEDKAGEYLLVVHTNRTPTRFQKMFLADPPRMVLDVAGSWTYHGPTSRVTGEGFIRQIRVGRHPDMFRVVLDMAPDALSRLRGTPTVERVPEGVALRIPK